MKQSKILLVVGSLRSASLNWKLANSLELIAPADFIMGQLDIGDLPLYNQDDDDEPDSEVVSMKAEIAQADGLIFITPEYNRSIPGVLKNAIDHGSHPYGKSVWANKPAGILGVSVGSTGTAMAQQHLRNILAYLDVPVMGQPEAFIQNKEGLFDDEGHLSEASLPFVQSWMDHYVRWIKIHKRPLD